MKNRSEVMDASEITATVEVDDQASAECTITGRPLEEVLLVGTKNTALQSWQTNQ